MSQRYAVALVGDYNPSVPAHQAIPIALDLAAAHHGVSIDAAWVATAHIQDAAADLAPFQGIWCVPASPYQSTFGALSAIQFARERHVPFLGTCGGFQHALMEYAKNVLGMANADHAELDPGAAHPLISALSCSLVEAEADLFLEPGSLLHKSYGTTSVREQYRCSYGPNPEHEHQLFTGSLHVTARDADSQVRGGELHGHPFFVGTLFQPERRALRGELPPLVREFAGAVSGSNQVRRSASVRDSNAAGR